jgi:hypothetical protein
MTRGDIMSMMLDCGWSLKDIAAYFFTDVKYVERMIVDHLRTVRTKRRVSLIASHEQKMDRICRGATTWASTRNAWHVAAYPSAPSPEGNPLHRVANA